MVKSVVREHHWTADYCKSLYLDSIDFSGLEFWYNDVVEISESLKKSSQKPKK